MGTPPERLGFSHANNGSTIPDTDEDGNVIYPEAQLEIENGLHQLETLLEATVDKTFDKFELFVLRNTFKVPDDLMGWIRLKHYEVCWTTKLQAPLAPLTSRAPLLESMFGPPFRCPYSRDNLRPAKEVTRNQEVESGAETGKRTERGRHCSVTLHPVEYADRKTGERCCTQRSIEPGLVILDF